MTKFLIIINPISGRGAGLLAKPSIENFVREHHLDAHIVISEYPGHTVKLANQGATTHDVIVAAGGDGTANEVINGIMNATPESVSLISMAVLSIGRGNDFAYGAGIPIGLESGLNALLTSKPIAIDIGRITGGDYPAGRYFGNGVGIGFDAVVGFVAAKSRLSGFLSYIVAALKTIFIFYSAPLIELEYDSGSLRLPALMVSVMNGKRMGGGFYMAPKSSNQDGLFDLCIAREVSKTRILSLIPHFLRGTQFSQPEIQFLQTSALSVRALNGHLPIHADGETICTAGDQVEIEIIPKALKIWKPLP